MHSTFRQGELPGRPGYGTVIWEFLFENQLEQLQQDIRTEIQRVCGGDPRILLSDIQVFPQENGMLIQIAITIINTTNAEILSIFFDQQQRNASYV